jgi:DNA modification methylase
VTPYYDDGQVTLYHADCRDVLPTLERGSVDLVLTDPPYNAGKDYGQHNDSMPPGEYLEWCRNWFTLVRDVCARTIVFPGHGNLPIWWDIKKPSGVGCWYKPGATGTSIIGWSEWEPWLYWTGDKGLLGGSDTITAPLEISDRSKGDHPCPKPVVLMVKLLLKCKSQAVLDPFVGTGTLLVAAQRLGRRAIGIEIEERYCEIAAKRLAQQVMFTEQTA